MSDTDNQRPRKPLGLKRSLDAGEVKQTFSHGRTNKVAVEVKRRRKLVKPGEAPPPPPPPPPPPAPEPVAKKPAARKAPAGETPQERVARLQREAEEERLRLAEEGRRRDDEAAKKAAEDEKRRAEDNRKAAEEAEQRAADAAAAAPDEASAPAADAAPADEKSPTPAPRRFTPVARPEPKKPEKKKKEEKRGAATGGERVDKRRSGKLTVTKALNEDEGRRARSLAALKRAREKERRIHGGPSKPREKQVRDVIVPEAITVQELANRMAEKGADLVKALFNMGMMVTVNQTIDADTAELLVEDFGHNIKRVSEADIDIVATEDSDPEDTLKPRPPVVTIMGHVDHGKTSLLDALRGTSVVKGEAGGITQHIGSYQVKTKGGDRITFLDTPGHAAFTEMRARGANVTDIVVLVVAADDGIMPQTVEAINHTKAAGVPMIVAINKVDKEDANPQRIRERLLEHEVIVEEMSGDVQDVEISALKKTGLDDLLEKIALQAELLELKANPDRAADATVIEAQLDKGRGPVASVLVTRGTLKRGDTFVVGTQSGRVRALVDDQGKQIKEAGPSMPVEVLGLGGVPMAGDQLTVVENEQRAREVAQYRQEKATEKRTALAPDQFRHDVHQPPVERDRVPGAGEGGRAGFGRGDQHRAAQPLERRDQGARAPRRGRRDHRKRRAARRRLEGADPGLQRAPQRQGARTGEARQRADDVLRRHLSPDRRDREGDGGRARAGADRNRRRPRGGQGSVPFGQEGQGRRPAGRGRRHPQGPPRAPHPRGRHRQRDHDRLAAALQGRCGRSPRRPRVRRGAGRHERHQAGRPARGVRSRGARADVVTISVEVEG